jgi:hypothetical protein
MSDIDPVLARRVAGSQLAQELLTLIEPAQQADPQFMDGLVSRLERETGCRPAPTPQTTSLARLRAVLMPFGQYQGRPLAEVPRDYLDWLCRSQEEFYCDLRAFLTHPELNHEAD